MSELWEGVGARRSWWVLSSLDGVGGVSRLHGRWVASYLGPRARSKAPALVGRGKPPTLPPVNILPRK